MEDQNPLARIFAQMKEAQDKAVRAHEHAAVFAQALKDEVAAAERIGACANCITDELVLLGLRRMAEAAGTLSGPLIAVSLMGLTDKITGLLAAAYVDVYADQIAARNAKAGAPL